MVILEKVDLEKRSWWANPAHASPPSITERDFTTKAEAEDCPVCDEQSIRMFTEGFVCLNTECPEWWKSEGATIEHGDDWTYSNRFLQQRFDRSLEVRGLDPALPKLYMEFDVFFKKNYTDLAEVIFHQEVPKQQSIVALCQGLMKGFACPREQGGCGKLNARVRWSEWHCANPSCTFRRHAPPPTLSPAFLSQCTKKEDAQRKWKGFNFLKVPGYQEKSHCGNYMAHKYKLAEDCYISILRPDETGLQKADDMFCKILDQANNNQIHLERRTHQTKGGKVLTNHFTMNYGEVYKYKTHVPTLPFADAPPSVEQAVEYMNQQLQTFFSKNTGTFNQLYFACYLAAMAMNMHDDGEAGLGPIVAGWNLGGRGTFSFAIKPLFDNGRPMTSEGKPRVGGQWITEDPLIIGCKEYEYRKEIQTRLQVGEITLDEWRQLFAKRMEKAQGTRRVLMKFPLDHGDIIVMHGSKTQTYLEHSAEVDKAMPMRLALTFRTVEGDMEIKRKPKRGSEVGEASSAKRHKPVVQGD
ncbi:unnamed protein product [Discula destructiva]